jgi:hypothetical protein
MPEDNNLNRHCYENIKIIYESWQATANMDVSSMSVISHQQKMVYTKFVVMPCFACLTAVLISYGDQI